MEDATKALLMAAGVFLGLMVITAGIFAYTQITDYYRTEENQERIQQVVEFNSEYDSYIRDDVRGSELLSLINKVVDYNKREADVAGIKFERMILIIDINGKQQEFKYREDYGMKPADIVKSCNNIINDTDLYKISNAVNNIQSYSGYTEGQLQSLAVNIANIFEPENGYTNKYDPRLLSAQQKRDSVVREITGKEYADMTSTNQANLKKATLEYYQYQQFKRAHFDCVQEDVRYNKNTGRIVRLTFEFNGEFE